MCALPGSSCDFVLFLCLNLELNMCNMCTIHHLFFLCVYVCYLPSPHNKCRYFFFKPWSMLKFQFNLSKSFVTFKFSILYWGKAVLKACIGLGTINTWLEEHIVLLENTYYCYKHGNPQRPVFQSISFNFHEECWQPLFNIFAFCVTKTATNCK